MENGTLFCVAQMHQGHNLCKLGRFCRNGLVMMSFFPSETLWKQTNFIACRNAAGSS